MNILDALDDPHVFGGLFRAGTWDAWRVFLAALFGLPMTEDRLATYQRFTGRSTPPTAPLHEAWLVIGRRGGKSFMLAVIAVFLACFRDWRPFLGPGEVGTVMVIAATRWSTHSVRPSHCHSPVVRCSFAQSLVLQADHRALAAPRLEAHWRGC
jgi:hypothetical protein